MNYLTHREYHEATTRRLRLVTAATEADPERDILTAAEWGMVSQFADDDTMPLPRDKDSLHELTAVLLEASRRVRMAMVRVQEELMSG